MKNINKKFNCQIYIRVAREEQNTKNSSIAEQTNLLLSEIESKYLGKIIKIER